MSVIINGTDGVTFNDSSLQGAAASPFGLKNRIINGDMRIAQRGTSAISTDGGGTHNYFVDRWCSGNSQASKFTGQQSAVAPTGFSNSLLITSTSAYTVGSGEQFIVNQIIEGFNWYDLGWGTANAQTVTLSFWVRSSLTGTFGGCMQNDNGSRQYPFSYSIPTANTWTKISITIAGDTSGTWVGSSNAAATAVIFSMGAGSTISGTAGAWTSSYHISTTGAVSVVGTNGATWYITGVQLEVGSTATPFERRQYGTELQLCQRYFYKSTNAVSGGSAYNVITLAGFNSTRCFGTFSLPVSLRASPTITFNGCAIRDGALSIQATVTNIFPVQTVTTVPFSASVPCEFNVASGLSSNVWYGLGFTSSGNDFYALSAEL